MCLSSAVLESSLHPLPMLSACTPQHFYLDIVCSIPTPSANYYLSSLLVEILFFEKWALTRELDNVRAL